MKLYNPIKQQLKSKRGDALVISVIVAMVIMMLFFCLYQLGRNISTISYVRDTSERVFDIYTTSTGKEIMSSIKSGNDYVVNINQTSYIKQLEKSLGLTNNNLIGYTDGVKRFKITNLDTSYIINNALKTKVMYVLNVPYYFFGIEVTTLSKKVVIECRYNLK